MTMPKEKVTFQEQFELKDEKSCKRAIRNGVIAALVSASITLLFAVFSFFVTSEDKTLQYLLDPWILVDVVLLLVLAFFVYKKSRTASTILLVYFIASKISTWYDLGEVRGAAISLIFFLFYLNAMRATYIWHSRYKTAAEPAVVENG